MLFLIVMYVPLTLAIIHVKNKERSEEINCQMGFYNKLSDTTVKTDSVYFYLKTRSIGYEFKRVPYTQK